MIDKSLILIIYRSSQSLKIVSNMFGMCIYLILSLIYQKQTNYDNFKQQTRLSKCY